MRELSIRTLQERHGWVELLRQIPLGVTRMPRKMVLKDYHSLKSACVRENDYPTPYLYKPTIRKGVATINKTFKDDHGESSEQRM